MSPNADSKTRAPVVDLLESVAAFVLPALVGGVGFALLRGSESFTTGLVYGGCVGYLLFTIRWRFRAFRTPDGIERRRPDPEDTWWTKVANIEYDKKYDRILAVVLALVGIAAFAAIPFVDTEDMGLVLRLVMVGLFGVTTSLMTYASLSLRSRE
ncbi:hypothetical protein [Halorussus amylolyticus]|uniref:hypothetical protein n=1 Tax=Halorussus amylolyticus TaxID=1126242 RepID=UPI00104E0417|nr:hypothetical protein [Halorussus amylolyticus]